MNYSGPYVFPGQTSKAMVLALAFSTASFIQAQDVEDPVRQDGLDIKLIEGKPVVGVDGHGILEVSRDPGGPWIPFRDAVPGAKLEAAIPLEANCRFFRIRRPDGRVQEVQSALNGLPPGVPRLQDISAGGFDGTSALLRASLPPGEKGPSILPFFMDSGIVIMRDDGTEGDTTAGDGKFAGRAPVDPNEVKRALVFLNGLPPGEPVIRGFKGRGLDPAGDLTVADSVQKFTDFLSGKPVRLPIPIGVAPSPDIKPLPVPDPDPKVPPITPCNQLPTWQKTLLITDLSVVNDPVRTFDPCTGKGTPMGAWSFGKLMSDIANEPVSGISPSDFARRWLRSWMVDQTINNDPVPKRTTMMARILSKWEAASGGPDKPLDMAKAPFRLLAIVNRLDLRGNTAYGGGTSDPCDPPCNSGEGRFVFCFCDRQIDTDPGGYGSVGGIIKGGGAGAREGEVVVDPVDPPVNDKPGNEFLVILEYCVPKPDCRELHAYAQQWANLQCIPFGPVYNAALQNITNQFAGRGAGPGRPNDSALHQLRTNENLLHATWELREFALFKKDSDAGHLRPVTVKQTPREDSDATAMLKDFITTTAPAPPNHTVPLQWHQTPGGPLAPFLGGRAVMMPISITSGSNAWATTGPAVPNMIRHHFALNTCNGCHSTETGARFTHVGCRLPDQPAPLSNFLIGNGTGGAHVVNLPGSPAATASFFDLKRREQDLVQFLMTPCGLSILMDRPLEDGAVH